MKRVETRVDELERIAAPATKIVVWTQDNFGHSDLFRGPGGVLRRREDIPEEPDTVNIIITYDGGDHEQCQTANSDH